MVSLHTKLLSEREQKRGTNPAMLQVRSFYEHIRQVIKKRNEVNGDV